MSTITHLTDETFATTIKGSTPVLVDFWAAWCGPCRMVAPVLEQLATDYDGRLRIAKLDVDAYQQVAAAYAVTGIPSMLLFQDGELLTRFVGFMPKPLLEAKLQPFLTLAVPA
jgi:thioredoxin 1